MKTLIEILNNQLNFPNGGVKLTDAIVEDCGADDGDIMAIADIIKEQYDVSVTPDEVEKSKNVQELTNLINSRIKQ